MRAVQNMLSFRELHRAPLTFQAPLPENHEWDYARRPSGKKRAWQLPA